MMAKRAWEVDARDDERRPGSTPEAGTPDAGAEHESDDPKTPELPPSLGGPGRSSISTADIEIPDIFPGDRPTRVLVVCVDEPLREETVKALEIGGDGEWESDAAPDTDTARMKLIIEEWDAVVLRLDGGIFDHRAVCRSAHTAPRLKPPALIAVAPLDYDLERELSNLGVARMLRPDASGEDLSDAVRTCLGNDGTGRAPRPMWEDDPGE